MQFKTVSDALHYRLAHGWTRKQLAQSLGVHRNALDIALNRDREYSGKGLKTLGLLRISRYQFTDPNIVSTRPATIATGTSRNRKVRKRTARAVPAPKIQAPTDTPMSTAEVLIAVKYRCNPGQTWSLFQRHNKGLNWDSFCKQRGMQQSTVKTASSLPAQAPVDPYAHLRKSRGTDFRRPLQRGELPRLDAIVQPQAMAKPEE